MPAIRPGSETSQRSEQLETLCDIAAELESQGAERSAEWVRWAADEIESLRLQLLLFASLEAR